MHTYSKGENYLLIQYIIKFYSSENEINVKTNKGDSASRYEEKYVHASCFGTICCYEKKSRVAFMEVGR